MMARKIRMEFAGAMYHVFNRGCAGNPVFEDASAAGEFEAVLWDAVRTFEWRLYGFVLLPDRFHLAIGLTRPNLGKGMHWLQSTFSNRRNRIRPHRGPLFEGRFRGLMVEDMPLMARLVEALHLLPLLEGIVAPAHFSRFRWSSFRHWQRPEKNAPLDRAAIDRGPSLGSAGPDAYAGALVRRFHREGDSLVRESESLCRGWALGSAAWRQEMARRWLGGDSGPNLSGAEGRAVEPDLWGARLAGALKARGRDAAELLRDRKGAPWKIEIARELRSHGAAYPWIAEELHMGTPNSVRAYVNRKE